MSKHLYARERQLEDAFRSDINYDLGGYVPPADYNARHGLQSVSHAFRTIPEGAHTTPTPLAAYVNPDTRNELLAGDESKGVVLLTLAAIAGFFLFLR